jgi:hypothetical protein
MNRQNSLKNFVSNQEVRQILPGRVQTEVLQPLQICEWTGSNTLFHLHCVALLFAGTSRTTTMLGLIFSRHLKIP